MPNTSGQAGNPEKNKWLTRDQDGIPLTDDKFQQFKNLNKKHQLNVELDK